MYPFINCVVYFFCCRLNPNKSDTLFLSDIKRLNGSHLDKANPVIVYLHGFSESAPGGAGQSSQELRDGNHCYIHLIANILQIETIHCILIDPLIFFLFFLFFVYFYGTCVGYCCMCHCTNIASHTFTCTRYSYAENICVNY